jgi:hypothetical protein
MRVALATDHAVSRSRPLSAARLVNLFAEPAPEGAKSKVVLYGTPGLKAWATVGSGKIRAGREALGYAYILSGPTLYRVDNGGNATACTGATLPGSGPAMMTDNGVQLGLLIDRQMFYASGTTVTAVTDTDFPTEGATSVDYMDGYGIFTRGGSSGQFFLSQPLDFSAYDALDFATAESSPDGLLRVLVDHREVWLIGSKTIEPWINTGASPFPFERVSGALIERGTAAALSAVKEDNSTFWLGDDRIVYRSEGYQPVRISTHEVEELLRVGEVSDAEGMTHAIGGHKFYVLRLPSKGLTIAYDMATKRWHLRQSGTSLDPAPWDVNCIFTAFGKTLAGGENGAVYELDADTYTDGGQAKRGVVTCSPIYPDGRRAVLDLVELECELGVGITTGQGSDPQVMMRFSRDGAMTWGPWKTASLGAIGNRRVRAKWENLGAFRTGVCEFAISDPVKVALYGMRYEAEELEA